MDTATDPQPNPSKPHLDAYKKANMYYTMTK